MVDVEALVGPVLFGVGLVLVAAWVGRRRRSGGRRARAAAAERPAVRGATGDGRVDRGRLWIGAFLLLATAFGAGGLLAVRGDLDADLLSGAVTVVVVAYLVVGSYGLARSRGHVAARATAEALAVAGAVLAAGVVVLVFPGAI